MTRAQTYSAGVSGPMTKKHFFDPPGLFKRVLSSHLTQNLHLDMAHFVGNQQSSTTCDIILKIEGAFRPKDGHPRRHECLDGVELTDDELVLNTYRVFHVAQTSIVDFYRVTLDRETANDLEGPSYLADGKKKAKKVDNYPQKPQKTKDPSYEWIVRRVIRVGRQLGYFSQLPAIRAEHEFAVYSRAYFATSGIVLRLVVICDRFLCHA
ncbi:hypothetical protein ACJ41O_011736 [Fusarium nematophilum]